MTLKLMSFLLVSQQQKWEECSGRWTLEPSFQGPGEDPAEPGVGRVS